MASSYHSIDPVNEQSVLLNEETTKEPSTCTGLPGQVVQAVRKGRLPLLAAVLLSVSALFAVSQMRTKEGTIFVGSYERDAETRTVDLLPRELFENIIRPKKSTEDPGVMLYPNVDNSFVEYKEPVKVMYKKMKAELPRGLVAVISPKFYKAKLGTAANQVPVGYQDLRDAQRKHNIGYDRPSRAHLFPKALGGDGHDWRNIVPFWQNQNSIMGQHEQIVALNLGHSWMEGKWVRYEVTATYDMFAYPSELHICIGYFKTWDEAAQGTRWGKINKVKDTGENLCTQVDHHFPNEPTKPKGA